MSDSDIHDAAIEYAPISDADKARARAEVAPPMPASPAAAALRAFEDDHLGADAVRIDGKIERGFGSPFAAMSDDDKRQYAALEKRIDAEQKLDEASAALSQAMVDHDAAVAAVEASADADAVKQ